MVLNKNLVIYRHELLLILSYFLGYLKAFHRKKSHLLFSIFRCLFFQTIPLIHCFNLVDLRVAHMLRNSIWIILFFLFYHSYSYAGVIIDEPNRQVSDGSADVSDPDIVVQGNTVYAAWNDERYYQGTIMFARSDDGGATWTRDILVSSKPYNDWPDNPRIAVQPDGTIWVAWYLLYASGSNRVNDIMIARSKDNGESWESYIAVDGIKEGDDLWKMRLAADENYVYLLYHDYYRIDGVEGYNIYSRRFQANTLEYSDVKINDMEISGRMYTSTMDTGPGIELNLRKTDQGGILCAAWEDKRDGGSLYGACSTDQGLSFSQNFKIGEGHYNPHLALTADGNLYAAYPYNYNVMVVYSTDLGQSWSNPMQVAYTSNDGRLGSFDLAVDGNGKIIVPWTERFGSGWFTQSNLNLSSSADGGLSFATQWDIEDDQGNYPTVSDQYQVKAVTAPTDNNDNYVYVAWSDTRNRSDEYWLQRALIDGTPPSVPANLVVTPADHASFLTWQPATDQWGISGYHVYRATNEEGPYTPINALLLYDTNYTDVSLVPGESYYYRVAAVDGTDNLGDWTDPVSVTVDGPTNLPKATIFYQHSGNIFWQNTQGGDKQSISGAVEPILSNDAKQLFYRAGDSIYSRPVTANQSKKGNTSVGEASHFYTRKDSGSFDIAADGYHFTMTAMRSMYSTAGGACLVWEPIYMTENQDLYTEQYDLGMETAISADHQWMAYRTIGACEPLAYKLYKPGYMCLINLNDYEQYCFRRKDIKGMDFSPEGHDLVFASSDSGQYEIWRASVKLEGDTLYLDKLTQLTQGPANQPADNPRWSNDGQWIVFQRDMDTNPDENATDWRLFAVRADGTGLRDLNLAGVEAAMLITGESNPPHSQPDSKPDPKLDDKKGQYNSEKSSGGGGSLGLWMIVTILIMGSMKRSTGTRFRF